MVPPLVLSPSVSVSLSNTEDVSRILIRSLAAVEAVRDWAEDRKLSWNLQTVVKRWPDLETEGGETS